MGRKERKARRTSRKTKRVTKRTAKKTTRVAKRTKRKAKPTRRIFKAGENVFKGAVKTGFNQVVKVANLTNKVLGGQGKSVEKIQTFDQLSLPKTLTKAGGISATSVGVALLTKNIGGKLVKGQVGKAGLTLLGGITVGGLLQSEKVTKAVLDIPQATFDVTSKIADTIEGNDDGLIPNVKEGLFGSGTLPAVAGALTGVGVTLLVTTLLDKFKKEQSTVKNDIITPFLASPQLQPALSQPVIQEPEIPKEVTDSVKKTMEPAINIKITNKPQNNIAIAM